MIPYLDALLCGVDGTLFPSAEAFGTTALRPDPPTTAALAALAGEFTLAAVGSGPLDRLAGSFTATGLDRLIRPELRFGSEGPAVTGRPDPANYRNACAALGVAPAAALAVEHSVSGVLSAVGAGCPAVGNLRFVPAEERLARTQELRAAGALAVVTSWTELAELLEPLLAERMAAAG